MIKNDEKRAVERISGRQYIIDSLCTDDVLPVDIEITNLIRTVLAEKSFLVGGAICRMCHL